MLPQLFATIIRAASEPEKKDALTSACESGADGCMKDMIDTVLTIDEDMPALLQRALPASGGCGRRRERNRDSKKNEKNSKK